MPTAVPLVAENVLRTRGDEPLTTEVHVGEEDVLRTRGDEPRLEFNSSFAYKCSPHTRG